MFDNLFYIELLIVIEIYICKEPVLLHLQLAKKKNFLADITDKFISRYIYSQVASLLNLLNVI